MSNQLKPISEWDHEYVASLSLDECDWLDFKGSAWLADNSDFFLKISKYLSAWANYEGGYLIIGIKEGVNSSSPQLDGGVDLSMKGGVKDWLENKLPSLVDSPLEEIEIRAIPSPNDMGRGVVVIHVLPSKNAPHLAQDRKFYTRVGSHNSPIGKQAILDIINRKVHPELRAELRLYLYDPDVEGTSALVCSIYNESDIFCKHVGVKVEFPIEYMNSSLFVDDASFVERADGKFFWSRQFKNGINTPLFPRSHLIIRKPVEWGVGHFGNRSADRFDSIEPVVTIQVFADGASPKSKTLDFNSIVEIKHPWEPRF